MRLTEDNTKQFPTVEVDRPEMIIIDDNLLPEMGTNKGEKWDGFFSDCNIHEKLSMETVNMGEVTITRLLINGKCFHEDIFELLEMSNDET